MQQTDCIEYYANLVSSSSDNPRQTINKLLHRNSSSRLPTCTSASVLADSLAYFFTDKISELRLSLSDQYFYIIISAFTFFSENTPLTSPLLSLLLNLKSLKSYSTVPTNNVIPILFLPGFSKNALHSWFLLSLT